MANSGITGPQFSAWLGKIGWTDREAENQLQVSRASIAKYRREGPPKIVWLACLGREYELHLVDTVPAPGLVVNASCKDWPTKGLLASMRQVLENRWGTSVPHKETIEAHDGGTRIEWSHV